MRILITVSDITWGGKHTYMYRAALALIAAGHDLRFLCETGSDLQCRLDRERLPMIAVADFDGHRDAATRVMTAAIDRHRIDLVIATGRRDYLVAWHAIRAGKPRPAFALVRLSGFPIDLSPDYVELFRNADMILVLTDRIIAQQFQPLVVDGTVPLAKFAEFRTTVDTRRFAPAPADRAILGEFGLSGAERIVCSVARLSWEKDHATLLAAFARIRPLWPGTKLLLVGDGELRGEIEALGARLGLTPDLILAGQREDLPALLSICDIHVLASICQETGALSLQEAMAMEVPVIASRIGVIPDYVRHEETGLLFTPGDVADLAACLDRLLADEKLHNDLGRRGRAEIVDRFDEQMQMRRLDRFLVDLVTRHREARS